MKGISRKINGNFPFGLQFMVSRVGFLGFLSKQWFWGGGHSCPDRCPRFRDHIRRGRSPTVGSLTAPSDKVGGRAHSHYENRWSPPILLDFLSSCITGGYFTGAAACPELVGGRASGNGNSWPGKPPRRGQRIGR